MNVSEHDLDQTLRRALRPVQVSDEQRDHYRSLLLSRETTGTSLVGQRSLVEFGVIAVVIAAVVIGIVWWQRAPAEGDEPGLGAVVSRDRNRDSDSNRDRDTDLHPGCDNRCP